VHIAAIALSQQESVEPDARFMQCTHYVAGSPVPDPEAAGGFWASDNLPFLFTNKSMLGDGPKATVRRVKDALRVSLTNGGLADAWFSAGDSNVMGWLEAKRPSGEWAPIEYTPWYSCGNSYHRVACPPSFGWTWTVKVPEGSLKTKVRWRYGTSVATMTSNEVEAWIPATRFSLTESVAKSNVVESNGGRPVLMPRR
jgi:hypothetical protein